jgi:beta-galactosidase/beta-glucuronidase
MTMVLQAEGITYGVEHWRRNRHRVSGTVYWQTNDCWPVASWSSLDYFGRWKALHYAARRFYAPVLLSIVAGWGDAGRQSMLQPSSPLNIWRCASRNWTVDVTEQAGQLAWITLQADTLARFVEVSAGNGVDAVFSDNYFDLPAGRSRTITTPLPAGWTLMQAQQALHVRSLYDAFA